MASSGDFNTSGRAGRYLNFSWNVQSQSTPNNSTTIKWTLTGKGDSGYVACGPIKVLIEGQQVYYTGSRINVWLNQEVASGYFTIGHDDDGNKTFSAYVEGAIYEFAINCSGSGSWALPKIDRYATMTSATDFTDIQNPSFTFNNPANSSMSCWLEPNPNGDHLAERTFSGKSGTYTWNLTEEERNQLRQRCVNAKSCTCRIGLYSTIGNNKVPSFFDKTLTIVNANPTFNCAYLDANATTVAITENNQEIIQNNSLLRINITNAEALKFATLSRAVVNINGVDYTGTFTGNSSTINVGAINVSQNTTATVTVYDSRSNTTTKNLNIAIQSWETPSAIITLNRKNNYYSETELTVDARYSSLNNKNSATIQYQYKKVDEKQFTPLIELQDNVMTILNLDNLYQWDIQIIITDRLGETKYIYQLDKGMPILFIDRLLNSLGVNCFPKRQLSVEIDGKSVMPITLYDNASGSENTITLNDNVNNYSYIEILYTDSNNAGNGSAKIANAQGKIIDLSLTKPSDDMATRTYIRRTAYTISGTTITPNTTTAGYVQISSRTVSTTTGSNYIKIYRVIGWE